MSSNESHKIGLAPSGFKQVLSHGFSASLVALILGLSQDPPFSNWAYLIVMSLGAASLDRAIFVWTRNRNEVTFYPEVRELEVGERTVLYGRVKVERMPTPTGVPSYLLQVKEDGEDRGRFLALTFEAKPRGRRGWTEKDLQVLEDFIGVAQPELAEEFKALWIPAAKSRARKT